MSTFFAFPTPMDGKSAYQEAVDNGFVGNEAAWLESLIGANGKDAYQQAVDNGFVGDITAWLASLVGPAGPAGPAGPSGVLSFTETVFDISPDVGSVITANSVAYTKIGQWVFMNGSFSFSAATGSIKLPHPAKYGFAMPIGPYSSGSGSPTMLVATQGANSASFSGTSSGSTRYFSIVYLTTTGGIDL